MLQLTQLLCLQEGTIIEVSTSDSVEDNYRVEKGDIQVVQNFVYRL